MVTTLFLLKVIPEVASLDGTTNEADCDNLGSINSFVVVVVVFEGVVVVGVVDGVVDNVVFVVVVDLLVDVFDAANAGGPHVIPKSLPLPPVKRKQICSRTVFNG